MHIGYIARSTLPSREANGIHVMKMCDAYSAAGHRVTLLVPHPGGRAASTAELASYYGVRGEFAIRRVPLPRMLPDSLTYGLLLPFLARAGGARVIHSRVLASAWGAATALRLPTLYELHDAPSSHPRQARMLERLVASPRLLDLVTITTALADHVAALAGRRPQVAPDGVDAAALTAAPPREEARRALGLEGESRRIAAYTGHLYRGRGVGLILELARRRPDHLFLLVGGRDEDLEQRRREASGLPNVHFAGFVPPARVPDFLAAADVLLMPYGPRVEVAGGGDTSAFASPLKMFEYMAAGRPILASTLPVLGEVLRDGGNALLLPHDHPERWEAALARLAADPAAGRALAEQARREVERHTWQERARRLAARAEARLSGREAP